MRTIRVAPPDWSEVGGCAISVPVLLDWPELGHLTEEQIMANAIALVNGENDPYPDPQLVEILIERPHASLTRRTAKS